MSLVMPPASPGQSGIRAVPAPTAAVPSPVLGRRIQAESIAWLTTASADGQPHVVPTWFSWDGQAFLIFTKPEALKARIIRFNPAVMLALGDPTADFDVILIEARADVLGQASVDLAPDSFFEAYSDRMAAVGLTRDEFLDTYTLAIRIRPTRYLGWSGRSHLAERRRETAAAR